MMPSKEMDKYLRRYRRKRLEKEREKLREKLLQDLIIRAPPPLILAPRRIASKTGRR